MKETQSFSIVIPTRNRTKTLEFCLRTCLNQINFDNFDIIVNDNGDNEETSNYITSLKLRDATAEKRISYFKRSVVCSMSENFDDALSKATGDYVIVIGDDDGILPMALGEINSLINKTGSAIIKWENGLYNWPDIRMKNNENYLGFSLGRSYKIKDGREELSKSMYSMNYVNLPMLYINTAVKRDVVQSLRGADGRIFRSREPDVFSSIVLGYVCGKFIECEVPFSIAGLSAASNGVSSAFHGSNSAPEKDFDRLNSAAGINFENAVPKIKLYPYVDFAESFLLAKLYYFSADDEFSLSRRRLVRFCLDYADLSSPSIVSALRKACVDDPHLSSYLEEGLAHPRERKVLAKLKPTNLGFDGRNMHIEATDFGITNIEDAVNFVHKIVWPGNAPLRYDLA